MAELYSTLCSTHLCLGVASSEGCSQTGAGPTKGSRDGPDLKNESFAESLKELRFVWPGKRTVQVGTDFQLWNLFPRGVVGSPSLEDFKQRLSVEYVREKTSPLSHMASFLNGVRPPDVHSADGPWLESAVVGTSVWPLAFVGEV